MSRFVSALVAVLLVGFLATGCKSSSSTGAAGSASSVAASATSGVGSAAAGGSSASSSASNCPTSNTTSFAKTKFVLHAGLAFGAFHRYLYKPYKAATFSKGANGRLVAFAKAAAAALFIKREVRLASEDAQANPTLCKAIVTPLQSIGDKIGGAVSSLKSGDASGITSVESAVQTVEGSAKNDGAPITEDENAPIS